MIDILAVANAVNRAVAMHGSLLAAVGERPRAHGRRAATPTPQVPINVAVHDQAALLADQLAGWARITDEESPWTAPSFEVQQAGRFLAENAEWIAGAGWAVDMVEELRDSTRRGQSLIGELPPRTKLHRPCDCGAVLWAYPESGQGGMRVECDDGHVQTFGQQVGSALVSIRGAQRIYGVRRATISHAVRSGAVTNHGTEDRPIIDTRELSQHLTSTGGDHRF